MKKVYQFIISAITFIIGVVLTVGLLLVRYPVPGKWGYGAAYGWPLLVRYFFLAAVLAIFLLALRTANRLIDDAATWKEAKVIYGVLLIAIVANVLYTLVVDFFAATNGVRALIVLVEIPAMYGKLLATLGRMPLKRAVFIILAGVLSTFGAGFIIASLIQGR